MHPLRSSRWEAGQRQAEREQAGGSRETGRLKQAMGTTEEYGQHVTMLTFKNHTSNLQQAVVKVSGKQ